MPYTWIALMAATIAVNTVFIFSLLAALTWEQRVMILLTTALLAGGLFFSIRTMQRINKPN
jgi:hypothetical protein